MKTRTLALLIALSIATARDGQPYRNTYTWYFLLKDAKVFNAIAFFDTGEFDALWKRVTPSS